MNANELADKLSNVDVMHKCDGDIVNNAEDLLRQQQAKIENLETLLLHYEIVYDGIITHPVKELTDEEMMKAEYEFMYWNRSLDKPLVEIAYELGVFKQAVAILRKAQK